MCVSWWVLFIILFNTLKGHYIVFTPKDYDSLMYNWENGTPAIIQCTTSRPGVDLCN